MNAIKLETQRLILRELNLSDLSDLYKILSDPESMAHYPRPYTLEETQEWIKRNMKRYAEDGFGLWAVILKDGMRLIGDCGITMQCINGAMAPEIGYHINKQHTGRGYATEAARACRNYAFDVLKMEKVYSYMKYTNVASRRVAEKNGMKYIMEYEDEKNKITRVYAITLAEYQGLA